MTITLNFIDSFVWLMLLNKVIITFLVILNVEKVVLIMISTFYIQR